MAVDADNGKTIEQRLRLIEDRLEIYNLSARHPPSADTGDHDPADARPVSASVCAPIR